MQQAADSLFRQAAASRQQAAALLQQAAALEESGALVQRAISQPDLQRIEGAAIRAALQRAELQHPPAPSGALQPVDQNASPSTGTRAGTQTTSSALQRPPAPIPSGIIITMYDKPLALQPIQPVRKALTNALRNRLGPPCRRRTIPPADVGSTHRIAPPVTGQLQAICASLCGVRPPVPAMALADDVGPSGTRPSPHQHSHTGGLPRLHFCAFKGGLGLVGEGGGGGKSGYVDARVSQARMGAAWAPGGASFAWVR
jgi:hypothetical protein